MGGIIGYGYSEDPTGSSDISGQNLRCWRRAGQPNISKRRSLRFTSEEYFVQLLLLINKYVVEILL